MNNNEIIQLIGATIGGSIFIQLYAQTELSKQGRREGIFSDLFICTSLGVFFGMYLSLKILSYLSANLLKFQDNCKHEARKMMGEKIGNSDVSLYQFLTIKDKIELAKYCSNVHIQKGLEGDKYYKEYPIYASTIKSQYQKGKDVIDLLNACKEALRRDSAVAVLKNSKTYPSKDGTDCLLSEDMIDMVAKKAVMAGVTKGNMKDFMKIVEKREKAKVNSKLTELRVKNFIKLIKMEMK